MKLGVELFIKSLRWTSTSVEKDLSSLEVDLALDSVFCTPTSKEGQEFYGWDPLEKRTQLVVRKCFSSNHKSSITCTVVDSLAVRLQSLQLAVHVANTVLQIDGIIRDST